ncbi:MAG: hypothetical protein U1E78_11895 [Gammaproteobacteria bacterium]
MNFILDNISMPISAMLYFSQTYESIGGAVTHRMQSGRAVKQTHFNKLKTVLSGQGWVPAGLDGLNYAELTFPRKNGQDTKRLFCLQTQRGSNSPI